MLTRRPVLLLLLMSVAVLAQAQLTDERHTLAVGVNGGANMSSVSFTPRIKQQMFLLPTYGLTVRYMSEKYFKMLCGLQAEVNLSQRGWNELIEDETGDTYSRTMRYVEVPLLAHLAFGKDSNTSGGQFFLNLGPQFSYFLSEEENPSEEFHPGMRGVRGQYGLATEKRFEYGIVAGMGVDVATRVGHFVIDARYYYGLSDFFGNTKKDYFARSGLSYIGIRLSYLVNLGK